MMAIIMMLMAISSVFGELVRVNVPSGSAYGVVGDAINATITSPKNLTNDLLIHISLMTNDTRKMPIIRPSPLVFRYGQSHLEFTITGTTPGRFPMQYTLLNLDYGNTTYTLSADEFVVFVLNDQWENMLIQFAVNVVLVVFGIAYFVWRHEKKKKIPFWGRHVTGLFEPVPFRSDAMETITTDSLKARAKRFWQVACDGDAMVESCGVDAALFLRFNLDAANMFTFLTAVSCALLLPINFVSGAGPTKNYQQATISNVPMYSNWFWGHVVMTYITSMSVLYFIHLQYRHLVRLHENDHSLLGPRSVFIQSGLPMNLSTHELYKWFDNDYPEEIDQVTVVHDLSHLYKVLGTRMALRNEFHRLLHIYGSNAPISKWMLWCPGNSCLPSPKDIYYDYLDRIPCTRSITMLQEPLIQSYSEIDWEGNELPPRVHVRLVELQNQLEAIPEDILESYQHRSGTGAAFIVFKSVGTRNLFLERYQKTKSTLSQCISSTDATFYRISRAIRRRISHRRLTIASEEPQDSSSRLQKYLKRLVIHEAPEPHDIKWSKMIYRPQSLKRYCKFFLYIVLSVFLLLLFSTPASVLLYFNLQPGSPVYTNLLSQDTVLTGFIHTYLPTLLLVTVNWLLLTILFYVSFMEPWFTESRRMRSFLTKGFSYLFLSSILFPSIGVTAVYATQRDAVQVAFEGTHSTEVNYVNDFLYKICSNFFIGYILQLIFLGSLTQLLRIGEKLFYQPWVISRAVTPTEIKAACQPWPFYFGYDYAVILSVFVIALLGCVLSPYLVPCGAVYFYVKYFVSKYNFLYVHPKTPGRGNVARSAYSLALVCLLIFELAMTAIVSQVGTDTQWRLLVFLCVATIGVFIYWRVTLYRALEKAHEFEVASLVSSHLRRQESLALSMLVFQANNQQELQTSMHTRTNQAYINPYDVGLKMLSVLRCHASHRKSKVRAAFEQWKAATKDDTL
ncbi:hypothetical protein THRCLA_10019 [Thraustotheca clavata]|uniref:Transmembrane protein n=1 Tax=Thraustotheca clavata TaxID=74557 RepID=A0A1V9YTG6_9STRA|nr:hypothetical protein THRCLA_10019 [Thraustotheca clavata]